MMRLKTDLFEVLMAVAEGRLSQINLQWDPRPALAVVAASKGYPGDYPKGVPITGIDKADALPNVKVFQAGTKTQEGQIVTDGGRVLAVTALGDTVLQAQQRAYKAMELIHFEGMHYRHDIGRQAVK
jgi:phosphoribosylamine--glycine ligase